jgi:hypothetical protein
MAHLVGDLALGAAPDDLRGDVRVDACIRGRGLVPGGRQEQPLVDRRRGPVGHRVHADPIWQFPTLPNVPEYMRATPGESDPSLGKPLSSMT